jgi:hypothetical protein
MTEQPEALFLADELEAPVGTVISCQVDKRAATELRRLYAENADLLEALRQSADLAEYWFLREDRRNLSDSEYKTWHSLGYGSSAYKAARAAHAKAEGK